MSTTDPQTPDQNPEPTPDQAPESTPDQTPDRVPVQTPGGHEGRGAAKRKPSWGYEVLLVFPLIALLNAAASPLFSAALSDRLPAVLEFGEPTPITLAGVELAVEGSTTLAVPVAELSTWAIGQFIAAKAIWIIGLFIVTWFASRAVSEVVQGRPFSDRVARGLAGVSWTLIVAGVMYAVAQVPADNLIVRDLGLRDAAVSNSVTMSMTYLWIGAVIFAELLRRAVRRGREVQDDLEGVI